jgi:hypothetical protein
MKRQPFQPTYKDTPTTMGSDLIEQLPEVASWVGRVAINWSGVEIQLALTLGSLLGVNSDAGVAVFLSLRNHRAQRDALTAAAQKTLNDKDQELFGAILYVHSELDKQRNDVIHGVWGRSEETPDGIIWSSLQDHSNMLINSYHRESSLPSCEEVTTNITKDYFVVRYRDLETLNSEIKALSHAIGHFHSYLRYRNQVAGQNAYNSLNNEPLIRKAIEKRNRAPQGAEGGKTP